MEIPGDLVIQGTLRVKGGILGSIPREKLATDSLKAFNVPLTDLRVWDAYGTMLPTTSSSDDLGLYTQTFGTALPYVGTSNMAGLGAVSRYARVGVQLPHNHVPGQTAKLRLHAGMLGSTADDYVLLELQARISNRDVNSAITGSNLVTTAATTINSLTFANVDFNLTATRLAPGTFIDCYIRIEVSDAVNSGSVVAAFTNMELICDVQG